MAVRRELVIDKNIKKILSERVVGQEEAIEKVEKVVVKAYMGLTGIHKSSSRSAPKGVLFFVGPTGVGKTELSKALAFMNLCDILEFAETMNVDDVREMVERQIQYNYAIAEAGIKENWGANVGSVLLDDDDQSIKVRARAMAAAGSDARMSGCELPVIIVSGSGNQGITASVPVITYAKALGVDHDTMVRAVTFSDLLTIHLKTGIGRLSAYCGVASAGSAAGAAICWLQGGDYEVISHCLINSLATISGMVCDGAKPSCASKIATAVESGILGCQMARKGQFLRDGDGLIGDGVENTIRNIGRLGHDGMKETDKEIIRIMTGT